MLEGKLECCLSFLQINAESFANWLSRLQNMQHVRTTGGTRASRGQTQGARGQFTLCFGRLLKLLNLGFWAQPIR